MIYALEGAKTFISANLEATLVAIEAEESITIERWKEICTYESKKLQFPLIELLPGETAVDYSDETGPMVEHWEYHNIDIRIGIAGQDTEIIERDLLFYREAIVRIVETSMSFGGLFNRVRLGNTSYSPLLSSEKEKKLLKILIQSLIARVLRG